jgi:hypothetical protein
MAVIDDKRRYISETRTLAIAQTVEITRLLQDRPVPEIAQQLRATLPAVASSYGTVASVISANAYNESRSQYNPPSQYTATPKVYDKSNELVQAAVGFSVAGLVKTSDYSTFQTNLAGAMVKAVLEYDKTTVDQNITADPSGTKYQRIASANACAFCKTMAAVAEVQRSAKFDGYHAFCNCIISPIFEGQEPITRPYYKEAEDAYRLASTELERQREAVDWYSMKTRQAAKLYPELTQTTENRLRLVRQITGWK